MSKELICPRSNQACPTANICGLPNRQLEGAVVAVAKETGGRFARTYIAAALIRQVNNTGSEVYVELNATRRGNDIVVCSRDIVGGEGIVKDHEPAVVAGGIAALIKEETIPNLVIDLMDQARRKDRT